MRICALLGNPVAQSVSPALHGALAASVNFELAYIKRPVPSAALLPEFLQALATLGAVGANITIPYKVAVLEHLDALAASAAGIGAVNTVVFDAAGRTTGHNTDGVGALTAMDRQLRPVEHGDRVVILGAGGAARAVTYEACQRGADVAVLTAYAGEIAPFLTAMAPRCRTQLRVAVLNNEHLLSRLLEADFLVNATPLGMTPNLDTSAVPTGLIERLAAERDMGSLYLLDAVYNPLETRLLRAFAGAEATVCSGIWMLIFQAIASFELWTGLSVGDEQPSRLYETLLIELEIGNTPHTPMCQSAR